MVIEARETGTLIGSDKVEGTAVYGADNQKIGSIERVMIDKLSGRVSYAVPLCLECGNILGQTDRVQPIRDPQGYSPYGNCFETQNAPVLLQFCAPSIIAARKKWG